MSVKDWERDVINRQRNIVFPDTNLNEGRFYRNIASGKAVFSVGQKVCLLTIVLFVTTMTSFGLAQAIAETMTQRDLAGKVLGLWGGLYLLAILLFWIFLGVKGLLPESPARKRRRGYRQSDKS
ncbi:MAG TPA: hypothetical protein VGR76_08210 [Candidatus Angelobacter sp.]|jgi:hypothetical protein|nr:hypothetical protein [Candidatus Angelobacter sp.]